MKNLLPILLAALFLLPSCGYNQMVDNEAEVKSAWGEIANVYQRRMDLAPTLIKLIKQTNVISNAEMNGMEKASELATKLLAEEEPSLSESYLNELHESQKPLSAIVKKLAVAKVTDSTFKTAIEANPTFEDLLNQLEGTENRITERRRLYNNAVKEYNTYISKFPQSMNSGIMGFGDYPYYDQK